MPHAIRAESKGDEFALPLSWLWSERERSEFSFTKRWSRAAWVHRAEVTKGISVDELCEQLRSRFPGGYFLRGCPRSFAETILKQGGSAICLGACAEIPLGLFAPSSSLRELASRVDRYIEIREIDDPLEAQAIAATILAQSRYASTPKLRYLFRTQPCREQRSFAAIDARIGTPLGFMSLSCYAARSWHSELLLRSELAQTGAMELLILSVTETLRDEGSFCLNLGEVPFIPVNEKRSLTKPSSALLALGLSALAPQLLRPSFNVKGLFQFKNKFRPIWRPVFWAGEPDFGLRELTCVGTESNALRLLQKNLELRTGLPLYPAR